jgi:hypothetical protein
MDSSTQAVRIFLESMLPVREALDDLLRRLYKRSEVKIVRTYHLQATQSPDFGLSAELHNGAVVDFWLELTSESDSWELRCYIARHDPDEDGSHMEMEFPCVSIKTVLEMSSTLLTAIEALEKASTTEDLYR